MLKRQQEGGAIADPASVEATIRMLAWTNPDQPARTWDLLLKLRDPRLPDALVILDHHHPDLPGIALTQRKITRLRAKASHIASPASWGPAGRNFAAHIRS